MSEPRRIGVPRSLLYHKHDVLWSSLFESLGAEMVLSPPTNRAILDAGCRLAVDETCLSVKIHLGHVAWLAERCDAVLVPRYVSLSRCERECVKMWALADIARNAVPDATIITYSVDAAGITHRRAAHNRALRDFARTLGATDAQAVRAVLKARLGEARAARRARTEQDRLLASDSDRLRILVVGHPYNLFDAMVGEPIIQTLRDLDCDVLLSEHVPQRRARTLARRVSPGLYWTNNQRLLGAVELYRDRVDGVIFLVTFPCGPDSLVTELAVRTLRNMPTATLVIDEQACEGGLQTRLESFVDITGMRRAATRSADAGALVSGVAQ